MRENLKTWGEVVLAQIEKFILENPEIKVIPREELIPRLDVLEKKWKDIPLGKTGYVYLLSREGYVLIHPELEGKYVGDMKDPVTGAPFVREMLTKPEGWIDYFWPKPHAKGFYKKLVYFLRVPELRWVIGLSLYQDEFSLPIYIVARKLLLLAFLIPAIAFLFGLLYTRSSISSINKIISALTSITHGKYDTQTTITRSDELGEIATTINLMAEALGKREESLAKYTDKIESLYKAGLRLLKASDPTLLISEVLQIIRGVFDADAAFSIPPGGENMLFTGPRKQHIEELWGRGIFSQVGKGRPLKISSLNLPDGKVCSLISVPLEIGGKYEGILGVLSFSGDAFTDEDLYLLSTYASFASLAIEKLRYSQHLEEIVKERTRELAESERKFRVLFEKASEGIFIYDLPADRIVEANPALVEMLGRASDELVSINPLLLFPEDERKRIDTYTKLRLQGDPSVPTTYVTRMLRRDGELLHVRLSLSPLDEKGRYVVVVTDITELVRLQNELMEANRELNEMAIRDPLTGVFNRRKLDNLLPYKLESSSLKNPLSLIFFDLDHFKNVNDAYGHRVGDFLLKAIVRTVMNNLRIEDTIFRYGGEEFIVLLDNTPKGKAVKVADRLRVSISRAKFLYRVPEEGEGSIEIRITCSFGVATAPEDASTKDELLLCADRALYEAKRSGRNRVVAFANSNKIKKGGES
jgi:diguanylate cyclase (GGDEF)-like protein/PAS domain S-box-containing protein